MCFFKFIYFIFFFILLVFIRLQIGKRSLLLIVIIYLIEKLNLVFIYLVTIIFLHCLFIFARIIIFAFDFVSTILLELIAKITVICATPLLLLPPSMLSKGVEFAQKFMRSQYGATRLDLLGPGPILHGNAFIELNDPFFYQKNLLALLAFHENLLRAFVLALVEVGADFQQLFVGEILPNAFLEELCLFLLLQFLCLH